MTRSILFAAAMLATLPAAALPASARTYTYICGPHDRVVFDDTTNTITWNKHVFANGHDEPAAKFGFMVFEIQRGQKIDQAE
jgi:hypothetical protein